MLYIFLVLCSTSFYSVLALDNTTASVKNASQNGTIAAKVAVQTTQQPVAISTDDKAGLTTVALKVDAKDKKPVFVGEAKDEKPVFVGEANSSIILQCPQEGVIKWYYNNEEVNEKDFNVIQANDSLEVRSIGPHSCCKFLCSNGLRNESVTLYVKPYVSQPDKKFKNVIEGDPFVMECKSWGYPEVTLNWTHGGQPIVINERIIFKDAPKNSTLRIRHTEYADAGWYVCTAENQFGNASMVMEMNVKDKLAALWPFLGICAEVAILCIIIIIFEKRRSKRLEAEESREEADHLNSGNESKVSQDLRQRKQ